MTWQTPKTNWQVAEAPLPADFNRIEGNIAVLKSASAITIADAAGIFTATTVEGALQELAVWCQ